MPVNIVKSETNVTTFVFNSGSNLTPAKAVRVVTIEGDPWFVAADVCKALNIHLDASGYVNTTNALRKLGPKEVTIHQMKGQRGLSVKLVSESGLYKLIMRSDKPEAKQFQNWVTQQVLPSIRKTGAYVVGQAPIETRKDDPFAFVEGQMAALNAIFEGMKAEREARRKLETTVTDSKATSQATKLGYLSPASAMDFIFLFSKTSTPLENLIGNSRRGAMEGQTKN